MKITLPRETLLAPLQQVSGAVEKRTTLPILSHVLVGLKAKHLELTGTDLEMQLVATAEADSGADGDITLPARKLLDIVRLLPAAAPVSLDVDDGGKATLKSGRSRYTLGTLPADTYPAFDLKATEAELAIGSVALKRALGKALSAMAIDDVRYYLNGMLLELDGPLFRAVASDGHRLAIYEEPLPQDADARRAILPRRAVLELHRLLPDKDEPVTLAFTQNSLAVRLGGVQFAAKLIGGRFPDFKRVMPKAITKIATVGRDALKLALTRLTVLATEKVKGITVDIQADRLILQASNPEHEEAEDVIDAKLDGEPVSIGFNAVYLLDVLANLDSDEARLSFTDDNNVCLVEDPKNPSYRFIVMPMRL